jgi:sn-1 stearoyl-lipid 9-desaturase
LQKIIGSKDSNSKQIQWDTSIIVIVFHVVAIGALFTFSWQNLIAAAIVWWMTNSWGIGLGYHRLLTHGGFKTPKWLEYFFTVCGTLALQSGSLQWVTTHRMHHAFTETEKDPHSPRDGTFWAHIGWLMCGTALMHDETTVRRYAPDLLKDKFHVFVSRYFFATTLIAAVILFLIGGWTMVLWGICLRQVIGWHSTFLVNSATHLWGTRRFDTNDDSRNNGLIAALTFGEGWHNNHHAHPRSARHGLAWYEFDINWMQIRLLEKIGLAKKVHAVELKKEELNLAHNTA